MPNRPASAAIAAIALCMAALPARADPMAATVSASGHAEATLAFDQAVVTLGVSTSAPTAARAAAEVDAVGKAVVEASVRAGVLRDAVATVGYGVGRVPRGPNARPTDAPGYMARVDYRMTVDDPGKAGAVLAAAVAAGANEVTGVEPTLRPDRDRDGRLLAAAVTDARRQASAMADAAGMRLGDATSIRASRQGNFAAPMSARAVAMDAAPVPSGPATASADVETTWALLPR